MVRPVTERAATPERAFLLLYALLLLILLPLTVAYNPIRVYGWWPAIRMAVVALLATGPLLLTGWAVRRWLWPPALAYLRQRVEATTLDQVAVFLKEFSRLYLWLLFAGIPVVVALLPVDLWGYGTVGKYAVLAALATEPILLARRAIGRARTRLAAAGQPWMRWAAKLGAFLLIVAFLAFGGLKIAAVSTVSVAVYTAIVWALSRPLWAIVIAASIGLTAVSVALTRWPNTKSGRAMLAVWLTMWFSSAHFLIFKLGPKPARCREILATLPAGVTPLLTRDQIGGIAGQEESLPYDAVLSSDGNTLIASLKRTDARPGALIRIDIPSRTVSAVLPVSQTTSEHNAFPEQLAIDPLRQRVFSAIYDPDHYRLLAVDYSGPALRIEATIPLSGEPRTVFVDRRGGKLIVLMVAEAPERALVLDLATLQPLASLRHGDDNGAPQYVTSSSALPMIYATNISPSQKLQEIDTRTLSVTRTANLPWPLIGLALDEPHDRLYASSPMTYGAYVFDRKSMRRVGHIDLSGGLGDIEVDPARQLLFSGWYGGVVDAIDLPSGVRRGGVSLGRMLRNIVYDAPRARLYACSGCGIWVIDAAAFGK